MWRCPSCENSLTVTTKGMACRHGHQFDRAKQGYINLLLANQKRSKEPGDNKQMINARREFLQKGFYQPLVQAIAQALPLSALPTRINLFDAGCGEGFYLDSLSQLLASTKSVTSCGCDISKIAIQKAAKKYPHSQFSVASSYNLPLADASQHVLIQVFAPGEEAEFHRVLAAGGVLVQVNPASEHLQQVKQSVYRQQRPYSVRSEDLAGFRLLSEHNVAYELELTDKQDRENLLMMTPFYWSACSHDNLAQVLDSMHQVQVDFHLRVWQKQADRDE